MFDPKNDPTDYEAPEEEAGGPNDDLQDADVPTVTEQEVEDADV